MLQIWFFFFILVFWCFFSIKATPGGVYQSMIHHEPLSRVLERTKTEEQNIYYEKFNFLGTMEIEVFLFNPNPREELPSAMRFVVTARSDEKYVLLINSLLPVKLPIPSELMFALIASLFTIESRAPLRSEEALAEQKRLFPIISLLETELIRRAKKALKENFTSSVKKSVKITGQDSLFKISRGIDDLIWEVSEELIEDEMREMRAELSEEARKAKRLSLKEKKKKHDEEIERIITEEGMADFNKKYKELTSALRLWDPLTHSRTSAKFRRNLAVGSGIGLAPPF